MTTAPKPFVFTLMPFDKKFDDIYKLGIKTAADEAGGYCERVDEQIFEERMLDRIYNQINKADVMVADLTDRNPNVFYEVGYAHALEKRVILLTQNSDDIPFDLKHHYHIVYDGSIIKLKEELRKRLKWYFENPGTRIQADIEQIIVSLNGVTVVEGCKIDIHDDGTVYPPFSLVFGLKNISDRVFNPETKVGLAFPAKYSISPGDGVTVFDDSEQLLILRDDYLDKIFPECHSHVVIPINPSENWSNFFNHEIPVSLIFYSEYRTYKLNFKITYIS